MAMLTNNGHQWSGARSAPLLLTNIGDKARAEVAEQVGQIGHKLLQPYT